MPGVIQPIIRRVLDKVCLVAGLQPLAHNRQIGRADRQATARRLREGVLTVHLEPLLLHLWEGDTVL